MFLQRIYKNVGNLKYNSFIDHLFRRNPLYYKQFYKNIEKNDTYDKKTLIDVSNSKLIKTLQVARKSRYATENGLGSLEVTDWPLLEKDTVRDNPEKLLVKNKLLTISASTSGSTGIPLKLFRSLSSISYEQATIDFIVSKGGVDLKKSRVGIFRGDNIKSPDNDEPPFWKCISSGKVAFSSTHLSRATIQHYYKFIKETGINVLIGYPSAVEELLRYGCDISNLPQIKGIVTSSEVLDDNTRSFFSKVCPNSAVIDYYGLAERMAFAYSFDGERYYFLPLYAYIELIFNSSDEDYDYYEIIGTSFINNAMPFVRFKTGDLMRVPRNTSQEELEDIRLGLKPFKGIVGRTVDYLVTKEGEKLVGMTLIPRNVENISQAQVYQKSFDHVIINVISQDGYSKEDEFQLIKNARTKIPKSIKVEVKQVSFLQKSASGKVPYVLRDL